MKTPTPFVGRWRIESMELWDRDAFDLLGPAHFTFEEDGLGTFRFIAVEGQIDCRFGSRDEKALVEFSWGGHDEADMASGRGWAVLDGDVLKGRIYIHLGDDSAFTAARDATRPRVGSRRKRA
ncbi:MAG: hypothetical protein JNM10_09730 [Planctomycetia bacterium]|nr:hypothetical protein [Planctomycetia bacterium]